MWCVAMAGATSLWISHIIVGCTAVSFSYHRDCTIINFDVLDIDKFQVLCL